MIKEAYYYIRDEIISENTVVDIFVKTVFPYIKLQIFTG